MPPLTFSREPALYIAAGGAVVDAAVVLAVSFGAPITPDQKTAINTLATALLALVAGALIRTQVTPAAAIALPH